MWPVYCGSTGGIISELSGFVVRVELGVESADMAAVVGGFLFADEDELEASESPECEAERLSRDKDRETLFMAASGAMLTSLERLLRCFRSAPEADALEAPAFGRS